jgi:hypothetical protein
MLLCGTSKDEGENLKAGLSGDAYIIVVKNFA